MGGGNGPVLKSNWFLSNMPEPLAEMVRQYQVDMAIPAFSYAVRMLLETHPDIARRVRDLYDMQSEHS